METPNGPDMLLLAPPVFPHVRKDIVWLSARNVPIGSVYHIREALSSISKFPTPEYSSESELGPLGSDGFDSSRSHCRPYMNSGKEV